MAISKSEMDTLPKIVAIDFDGTLVSDNYPNIGSPNTFMFRLCKALQKSGVKLILWTCRDSKYLLEAVDYCAHRGLFFDAVNVNLPETIKMFNNDTRKIYADLYIDDKAIPHIQDPLFWVERVGLEPQDFRNLAFGGD
jgi:hydroxymethylpyrimidine pyrophosphatase-like HAD family hydrolase